MQITTKFAIGQEIYCITEDNGGKWVLVEDGDGKQCFTVASIEVYGDHGEYIEYQIGIGSWGQSEEDCFPTEAEALQECDRRNGGTK